MANYAESPSNGIWARKMRSTRTSKTLGFPSPPKAVQFCFKWSLHRRPGTPTVTSVAGLQRAVLL
jgi:hypothetical protein